MDINRISPSNTLDAVFAAVTEASTAPAQAAPGEDAAGAPGGGSDVPGPDRVHEGHGATAGASAGQGTEHASNAATAPAEAVRPEARIDRGAEAALVQTFARPDRTQPASARPPGDAAPAAPALAGSDFSLPADQLLNAAVIGLQVESAFAWQLQRRGADALVQELPDPRSDAPTQVAGRQEKDRVGDDGPGRRADRDDHDHAADTPEPQDDGAPEEDHAATRLPDVLQHEAADDWPQALSLALREALRVKPVAQPLLAAAEQWRAGRCIVLACPQGVDPAGPAWAFVLWPRGGSLAGAPLTLSGLRVDARLRWSRLPPAIEWCHARVMKEQHPRQGRQLVALDARGTATVACEVQLGPVPLRTPRWRHACVRVDAVRAFWNALGQQWSVTVVVGSRPLAGIGVAAPREVMWEA
jgi:hypothetical protein